MEGSLCYLQQRIKEGLSDVSYGTPVCVGYGSVLFWIEITQPLGGKNKTTSDVFQLFAAPRITHSIRISTRI